jgi:5-methylcytosine-specific restriction endonuclease McrA
MAHSDEVLIDVYDKNDCYCYYCDKKLAFTNYGVPGAKGAWEVDHRKPRSRGGSNRIGNLVPSCIPCNRSKGSEYYPGT